MTQIINHIKPIVISNEWLTFQKLENIFMAVSQKVIFTIEEDYRDFIEPFHKGYSTSYRMREYKFVGGKWKHVEMTILEDIPNIENLLIEFSAKGFTCKVREMNTKEEIQKALNGIYTKVVIDEFHLNRIDETLEVSCFTKGTVLKNAFEFSIEDFELEKILQHLGVITSIDEDVIETPDHNFEDIYQLWETINLTEKLQNDIVFQYINETYK